jgi:5-methylcytosine-specific restriction endonuclease McrA
MPRKPTKPKRKPLLPGLRFDVLSRAKFRCQACGVGAKEARLEIDHKIPVSKGGATTLRNLQVLCRSCNRGKSAKMKAVKKK